MGSGPGSGHGMSPYLPSALAMEQARGPEEEEEEEEEEREQWRSGWAGARVCLMADSRPGISARHQTNKTTRGEGRRTGKIRGENQQSHIIRGGERRGKEGRDGGES